MHVLNSNIWTSESQKSLKQLQDCDLHQVSAAWCLTAFIWIFTADSLCFHWKVEVLHVKFVIDPVSVFYCQVNVSQDIQPIDFQSCWTEFICSQQGHTSTQSTHKQSTSSILVMNFKILVLLLQFLNCTVMVK